MEAKQMNVPYVSDSYLAASKEEIDRNCNNCGLSRKITLFNWICGVNVLPACAAHDWEYEYKAVSRRKADDWFYSNLRFLIKRGNLGWFQNKIAKATAWMYFQTVRAFGGFVY